MQDPGFDSLKTERLTVRRFRGEDVPALVAHRNDSAIARFQEWETCSDAEVRSFLESLEGLAPGTPGRWFQLALESSSSGELLGDCALHCPTHDEDQGEIGFTLATAHQGRGYGTEAVGALLEYAFTRLELHRVHAIADEKNHSAHALLERLGFRIEGRFRENTWFKGEWASERLYAMLADEWSDRDKD